MRRRPAVAPAVAAKPNVTVADVTVWVVAPSVGGTNGGAVGRRPPNPPVLWGAGVPVDAAAEAPGGWNQAPRARSADTDVVWRGAVSGATTRTSGRLAGRE